MAQLVLGISLSSPVNLDKRFKARKGGHHDHETLRDFNEEGRDCKAEDWGEVRDDFPVAGKNRTGCSPPERQRGRPDGA